MNTENILSFLSELTINNNREWFNNNKKRYLIIKKDIELFAQYLIKETAKFDPDIKDLQPKDCIFRIYRDLRFSPNKEPYKTNIGIYLSKGGKKSFYAGYYFHLEPSGCFAGGGLWMPPKDILNSVRKEIFYNADQFKKIINNKSFRKYYSDIVGDKLVNSPKEFPPDFPDSDLLKYKSYVFTYNLNNKELNKELQSLIPDLFKALLPLVKFINNAIDDK